MHVVDLRPLNILRCHSSTLASDLKLERELGFESASFDRRFEFRSQLWILIENSHIPVVSHFPLNH